MSNDPYIMKSQVAGVPAQGFDLPKKAELTALENLLPR